MNRNIILLVAASTFAVASLALGAGYTGSVLYPLATPASFSSIYPRQGFAGQTIGQGQSGPTTQPIHALLWTPNSVVDLNPTNLSGIVASQTLATNGTQQVGDGSSSTTIVSNHALLWSGTANSAVDLNPTNLNGISTSMAYGISGIQEVGEGNGAGTGNNYHAMLWNGTASSAVDLNPTVLSGLNNSFAYATDVSQQVGWAYSSANYNYNAMLWSGTAASAVDLNTNLNGITESYAYGVSGTQQVGLGIRMINLTVIFQHALLWTGTAASAVDLNPAGFNGSEAVATNGKEQVGSAGAYAMLWSGTAESAINLQSYLPLSFNWLGSSAYSIDASGNVYGIADAQIDGVLAPYAVEWSPVPEPATGTLLMIAGVGMLMRRCRKQLA